MNERKREDAFCEAALSKAIGTSIRVRVFDEIDSTSNEAKRMAADGADVPTLIAAARQTAGRGRMGRSFYSPAQTGAYFSVLYPICTPLWGAVSVTGAAAVATMRAIRTLTGKQTQIKWVNDLYLDGKKICGILTEAVTFGERTHLIVGIGVNLNTQDFPNGLNATAGSLNEARLSRTELIAEIFGELRPFLDDPSDRSWLDDYRAHSCVLGRQIVWMCDGEAKQGIAVGINQDGELEVVDDSGKASVLRTGEISVRVV